MVLVLCIGDLHVPSRAPDLPPQFKALLKPGKIQSILCFGNVTNKLFLDYLRTVAGELHCVQGDFDEFTSPEQLVLDIAGFKVGLCHGHQVVPAGDPDGIAALQRAMGVDVLITGGTHEFKTVKTGSCLHISPGSASGAYHPTKADVTPSFVLLDLDGARVTVYVYQLVNGEVKVEKIDYAKAS